MDFEYLGPYKVLGVLGKGGMGTVFKAEHSKTGDLVAVKVIAESIANQERFRRRFDGEIETLRRLSNKFIVKLIGYGEEKGRLFYSMEYVEGESLHDKIKREGRLTWDVTLKYSIDVCSALKHAHDIGVIHRDLKPSNLLIDKGDNIKMTDFGIAKLYGGSEETVMGSILGTADFMPPEQAEGTRVTTRSDLYALGAVMYTCLSGRSPHYAKSTPETLYNVRYKIPERLSERVARIPRELEILILELLEKNPDLRPKTALLVLNRLAAMQAGLSKFESVQAAQRHDTIVASDHDFNADRSLDLNEVAPSLASEVKRKDLSDDQTQIADFAAQQPKSHKLDNQPMKRNSSSEQAITSAFDAQVTSGRGDATDFGDVSARQPSTRYTSVDADTDRTKRTTFDYGDQARSQWSNFISIASLVIAIVACIAGIIFATRKPSADDLYRHTLAAVETSSMEEIGTAIDEFRSNYPQDDRLNEFADFEAELKMQRRINSLSRRLRRMGDSGVTPVELSFVEAMNLRDQDQDLAVQRLRDMLVVYQVRSTLTPQDIEILDYAAEELVRLTRSDTNLNKRESDFLMDQLSAAEQLEPLKQIEFYRSFIRLYESRSFAKEAVNTAKRKLDVLSANR